MSDMEKVVTVKMTALQAAIVDTCLEQVDMNLIKTVAKVLEMPEDELGDRIFDLEMLLQPNRVRMLLALNEYRAIQGGKQ